MSLDPQLLGIHSGLRPFRRRLWFRRIVRDAARITALAAVIELALALTARVTPLE
nr:hypothetical protein [Chloroflexota bacterium]